MVKGPFSWIFLKEKREEEKRGEEKGGKKMFYVLILYEREDDR